MPKDADVIVIGAGVAGLRCARDLVAAGLRTLVLEKSRGVGGRCATRRVEGHPVDFGSTFFHGSEPGFLDALAEVADATPIDGWPRNVLGAGRPCQPRAFDPSERRIAFREGITAFPKHLARGLDVRLQTRVRSISTGERGFTAHLSDGGTVEGSDLVVAIPAFQALELIEPLASEGRADLRAAVDLLENTCEVPCLTLIAGYSAGGRRPEWDVCYPDDSKSVQMISHDSAKRDAGGPVVLVFHADPSWSRHHWDEPPDRWAGELQREGGRIVGSWTAAPVWSNTHRWRHARSNLSDGLCGPMLIGVGRGRVGLAGESFWRGSGVQAAWMSGGAIARRIVGEA